MNGILNFFRKREDDPGVNASLTERGERRNHSNNLSNLHISYSHSQPDAGDDDRLDLHNDLMQIHSSTNIVSVLNTPRKTTFLDDIYEIFQETVVDQALNTINMQGTPTIDPEILNVQYEDFFGYTLKIRKVLDIYKKNKIIKSVRQKEKEQINISESLVKCYNLVKPNFFDEKYIFDFGYLKRDMRQLRAIQDELTESLDHVELNLFYQITSRFHDIMNVISNLNEMEIQVENCLKTIEFHKNFNKEIKEKAYLHSIKILQMKRKQINISRTLQMLELVSVVRQTVPTLKQLIKNTNYDYAVALIKNSEETYKTKLKNLSCLQNVQKIFVDARSTLEKNLNTEFVDKCLAYAINVLSYNKNANLNLDASSIVEESFMMDLSMLPTGADLMTEDSGRKSLNYVTWSLVDSPRDGKLEEFLTNLVVQTVKVKEFNHRTFKMKLLDSLKLFHKQFMKDMTEYQDSLKPSDEKSGAPTSNMTTKESQQQKQRMSFDLYVKFLLFYFEMYKRLLSRLLDLHNKILTAFLEHFEKNYISESDYVPSRDFELSVLDKATLRIISDTVEDFYSTIAMVVKYLNERLAEMISSYSTEFMTIAQFYKLQAFFDEARKCFEEQLKIHSRVSLWVTTENQTLLSAINKAKSTYLDKISIGPLMHLKLECERSFIEYYHVQRTISLRQHLEEETWQPTEIPFSYMKVFTLFFDPTHDIQCEEMEEISNTEEILKSSKSKVLSLQSLDEINQGSDNEDDPKKPGQNEESKTASNKQSRSRNNLEESGFVRIMKNELFVGERKYKLTSSVLLVVRIVYDYLILGYRFKGISMECFLKTMEFLQFYNTMSTKLILSAGVVQFKIIKTITAKILGLSSLNIAFLKMLLEPMQDLVEKKFSINKEVVKTQIGTVKSLFRTHITDIQNKIASILRDRIKQHCTNISQLEWTKPAAKINVPTKSTAQILTDIRSMAQNIEEFYLSEELFDIFSKVFENIKTYYLKIFNSLEVDDSAAAQRVKEELEYFLQELKALKVAAIVPIDEIESTIQSIVANRCNIYLEETSTTT